MNSDSHIRVQSLDPREGSRWDSAVARFSESATAFHSAGWASAVAHTYGHTPAYWVAGPEEQPDIAFPLMTIRSPVTGCRGVCLPLTDFCAPLLQPGANFPPLWDAVCAAGRAAGWRYIEWRGPSPVPGATPATTFIAHVLDLRPGRETVLRGFNTSVHRALRRAETSGLQVRFGSAQEDVDAYYRLHCLTRRRHGLPPQPKRFFDELGDHMLRKGHGFIAQAFRPSDGPAGQPLAAAVFLHFGRHAIYKFGASDLRQQSLRANNLVMSCSILRCLEMGMNELHMGRTDATQEGLRRFKRSWGAREAPLHYYRYGLTDGAWMRSRSMVAGWHNRFFRRLHSTAGALRSMKCRLVLHNRRSTIGCS